MSLKLFFRKYVNAANFVGRDAGTPKRRIIIHAQIVSKPYQTFHINLKYQIRDEVTSFIKSKLFDDNYAAKFIRPFLLDLYQ